MPRETPTHQAILDHATALASQIGLEGLTIGQLAEALKLSKSGLFAHFGSKEALQLAILEHAARQFVDRVVKPTLQAPRGEPRIRAVFEHWLNWSEHSTLKGGCLFVSASIELDDKPGPVRDRLVELQRDWLELLANLARTAIGEGVFRADVDPEQFAYDLYGIILITHHYQRLLRDSRAEARGWTAVNALIDSARAPKT